MDEEGVTSSQASDRHRAILQTAMDGFWLVDARGYLLDVNDSYCRMSGYGRAELLAMHISDLEDAESPDETRAHVQKVVAQGQDRFETRHRRKDGSVLHVEVSARHRDGLFVAFIHDITKRKRAEAVLRASEENYRALVEGLPDIVTRRDREGRILFISANVSRTVDLTPEQFIGKTGRELGFPEEQCRLIEDALQAVVDSDGPVERELEYASPRGMRVINTRIMPERDGTGVIRSFLSVARDVTAQHEAERALRQSRERYRNILETAMDGFRVCDAEGRILEVNDAYCRMTGYGRAELLAMRTPDVDAAHDTTGGMAAPLAVVMREGEGRFEAEHRRKDGSTFPIEVSVQYREGVFLAFIRDITARKAVERSLEESRLDAEAASVAKSRFLANMSHEIRTPLNGVLGMAAQLLGTGLSEEQKGYVSALKASSKALLHVISDILDFSKIEAGRLELEAVDFDLGAVFADTAALLAIPAQEKGLALSCMVAANVPALLRGDHTRLRQVLLNLGFNAVKFTEHGSVALRALAESETAAGLTIRFEVEDTGMGIADDQLALLFQEFQQGDSSITRRYGGSGLGLAISRGLVGLMRGDIGVERRESGTLFWFTVVLARAAVDPRARSLPPAATPRDGLRVLLAEDDRTNQLVAKAMLSRLGCVVDVVANGQDAVTAARATAYDVVLMDMQMPVMDGLEATRELRRHGVRVPIIALTAHASHEAKEQCLEVGMDDYVSKPIDPASLARALTAMCERPSP